jgi:hypothetical protein
LLIYFNFVKVTHYLIFNIMERSHLTTSKYLTLGKDKPSLQGANRLPRCARNDGEGSRNDEESGYLFAPGNRIWSSMREIMHPSGFEGANRLCFVSI